MIKVSGCLTALLVALFVSKLHGKSINIQIECEDFLKILSSLTKQQNIKIEGNDANYGVDSDISFTLKGFNSNGEDSIKNKNDGVPQRMTVWQSKHDMSKKILKSDTDNEIERENDNYIEGPAAISEDELEVLDDNPAPKTRDSVGDGTKQQQKNGDKKVNKLKISMTLTEQANNDEQEDRLPEKEDKKTGEDPDDKIIIKAMTNMKYIAPVIDVTRKNKSNFEKTSDVVKLEEKTQTKESEDKEKIDLERQPKFKDDKNCSSLVESTIDKKIKVERNTDEVNIFSIHQNITTKELSEIEREQNFYDANKKRFKLVNNNKLDKGDEGIEQVQEKECFRSSLLQSDDVQYEISNKKDIIVEPAPKQEYKI